MDIFPAPLPGLSGQVLQPDASTTATFTVSAFPGAKLVDFTVTTVPAVMTLDGSVPSATNGLVYPIGGPYTISILKAKVAKFRGVGGTAVIYGMPLTF